MLSERVFYPLLKSEYFINELVKTSENNSSDLSNEAELKHLRTENALLRETIGQNGIEKILAGVMGRPTALPYDVLVIDRGQDDGILENAPVYSEKNQIIGFVVSSQKHSSIVALASTPGFTSSVYVYGPNIYTTAVGQGGGVMRIHVPQGINLQVGNTVALPSLSAGIFGEIVAVDSVPSRQEQYGYVVSQTPLSSLRYVSVGKRPLEVISFEEAKEEIEQAKKELLQVEIPEGVLVDVDISTSTDMSTASSTTENNQ